MGGSQGITTQEFGRRLGGPIALAIAQLTKSFFWLLLGYVALGPTLAVPAILELLGALLLTQKRKMPWFALVTICLVELAACAWSAAYVLTLVPPILLTSSMVLAAMGFSMVWIVALFELVAANTNDVKTHYLGGQPPPFKPTYTESPPEPQF